MPLGGTVQLQDFCDVVQGGRLGLSGNDFVADGYPAFGAGGINGNVAIPEFHRPAVVLSSIGARCGKCFYADGQWTSLANTQVILPDLGRADCKYLWFQLNDERRWHRSGTAQPFIKPSDVKSHRVFLPPLPEQRRIAEVLNRAEALRAKRRAALGKVSTLVGAIFVDMFGDPARNAKGLPRRALGDIFEIARGGSPRPIDDFVTDAADGINWITISDATDGDKYIRNTKRRITAAGAKRSRLVQPGDFLLTNSMSFGRPYISSITGCIHDGWLALSPREKDLSPDYFFTLLSSKAVYEEFARRAPGATVKNLNIGLVREVVVPVAPMKDQARFASAVRQVEGAAAPMRANAIALDSLFASLQSRAFRGEL